MPKIKNKILTRVLYSYTTPRNLRWLKAKAKKNRISRSLALHLILTAARKNGFLPLLLLGVLGQGCGRQEAATPVLVDIVNPYLANAISTGAKSDGKVQFINQGQTLGYCTLQKAP